MTNNKAKPYFKLHFIVLIAAFTAVLGELITLPAYSLVIWRTAISAFLLGIWLRGRIVAFPFKRVALFTGLILGAHWITFFGAVKLANISICLTGMATASLFTAATEAIQEKRLPYKNEIWLGIMIIPGIILVAGVETAYLSGLLCGILSALFAAIFPVINKSMVRRGAEAESITFYEMIGAVIICALFGFVVNAEYSDFVPTSKDWLWLLILAVVCTVYAFILYVNLLKYFSAYESTLAMNFEPVYGIILAAIFFAEHEKLHPLFFLGAGTIIFANLLKPILSRRELAKIKQSEN